MSGTGYQRPFLDLQDVGLEVSLERIVSGSPAPAGDNLVLAAAESTGYRITVEPPKGVSWRDLLEKAFPGARQPAIEAVAFWRQASPVEEKVKVAPLHVDHEGPVLLEFAREWYQHGPKVEVSVRIVLTEDLNADVSRTFAAKTKGAILYHHTFPKLTVEGEGGHFTIVRAQMELKAGVGRVRFDGTTYHIEINSSLVGDDEVAAVGTLLARAMRHACETAPGASGEDAEGDVRNAIREYTVTFEESRHTIQDMYEREEEDRNDLAGSMLERWCVQKASETRDGGRR